MAITRTTKPIPTYDWAPGAIEKLSAEVQTNVDPTGVAVTFCLVLADAAPSGYQAGAWRGSWRGATGLVEVVSPTISDSSSGGTLTGNAAGGAHYLYVKWTVSGETIVRRACQINFE